MVKVENKYVYETQPGETLVNIMRGCGSFGNPFVMENKSAAERDRVCDLYITHLTVAYKKLRPELIYLAGKSLTGTVVLLCCCKPKRCHGDSIKQLIDGITDMMKVGFYGY